MSWQYSRIDHLQPLACCVFCGRALKSLKGIIVTDGAHEAYAGPNCAKKHLGPPDERLLDVASLAILVVTAGDPNEAPLVTLEGLTSSPKFGVELRGKRSSIPLQPIDPVIQYLRLRYEAMPGFRYQKSQLLSEAYEAFQTDGALSEFLRKRVVGMMRSASEQRTVFCMQNVKHCIGFDHWLQEALLHTHVERRDFLEAMIYKLHSKWSLTPAQVSGINGWGHNLRKRIHDFPHLDTSLFDGILIPEFMRAKQPRSSD